MCSIQELHPYFANGKVELVQRHTRHTDAASACGNTAAMPSVEYVITGKPQCSSANQEGVFLSFSFIWSSGSVSSTPPHTHPQPPMMLLVSGSCWMSVGVIKDTFTLTNVQQIRKPASTKALPPPTAVWTWVCITRTTRNNDWNFAIA